MARRAEQIRRIQDSDLIKGNFDQNSSLHADFDGIPWIVVKGLNYSLSEGDICTVFEQFGTIIQMELLRDDKSGTSKGTCFICYEDWRSSILAVDNFNGITLLGRTIAVDHIKFQINPKSQMTDPRTITPARLQNHIQTSVIDDGTASETETDTE